MIEKLIAAFDRYDKLLHGHITEEISERNDPQLEEAAVVLNKTAYEAKEAEAKIIETLKVDFITAAMNVNDYAERKDVNRNHVNYGIAETCAKILRLMGYEVETLCYGDGDYLKIPKIIINGNETAFHNG